LISDKTSLGGFSLIELLVVITIISSLGALVGPSLFKQVNKIQVVSDEKKLLQILKQLSHKAFLSGKPITIQLKHKELGYFYSDEPSNYVQKDFTFIQFSEQTLRLNENGFIQPNSVQMVSVSDIRYLNIAEVNAL
jgi:prepilin-type N-terminal cleavage/methylation domain-containing protein